MPQEIIREHIELVRRNTMRYFVTDLHHGYVLIGEYECFRGRIIYMAKTMGIPDSGERIRMLQELSTVGKAVSHAFGEVFLMEGDAEKIMYWHTMPPCEYCEGERAIWWLDLSVALGGSKELSAPVLETMRDRLADAFLIANETQNQR